MGAIEKLQAISRQFGPAAARTKLRLLREIATRPRLGGREIRLLGETLDFLRAYPDSPDVLQEARSLAQSIPASQNVYEYSYRTLLHLVRLHPGALEIDWDELEDQDQLLDALGLAALPGEVLGLEDIGISLEDWLAGCKTSSSITDLEFLLELFEGSKLAEPVRAFLFENSKLPVRYRGPRPAGLERPVDRLRYQRHPIQDARAPITRLIRQPLVKVKRAGQRVLDLAIHTLSPRTLEIYPLLYGNPEDVVVAECSRGFQVALAGVLPHRRLPLESLYFFLILKNGVPIAYGPAAVFLGCCELGINLFPQFRGGETRYLYAQFMRTLHQLLGADYFFLTSYGMGEGNDEALRTGAFWFYRSLGLLPTNPEVEALARAEEAKKTVNPRHRSDLPTLRRLSRTQAFLDLSDGKHRPLDLGGLGLAQSRMVTSGFAGDRARAEAHCAATVSRLLGVSAKGHALRAVAPLLSLIPDLGSWSAGDRTRLGRAFEAKDQRSEARAAKLLTAHRRLDQALRLVAADGRAGGAGSG